MPIMNYNKRQSNIFTKILFLHSTEDNDKSTIHHCRMPPHEDVVVKYIDSGCCVNLRRKFRRLLTVSDVNPCSKQYLRSSAAIQLEKARHLQHNYYMIHPFSDGRAYWEFFMMFVLLGLLIVIPIENAMVETAWYLSYPKLILNLICCVDIGVTFASGYYHRNSKRITLNFRRVARRYLAGYFLIDLLSSVPVDLFVKLTGMNEHLWTVRMLTFLKLLRITTFVKYLDRFRDQRGYGIYKFRAFKLILILTIALLWSTSIMYIIARVRTDSWLPDNISTSHGLLISCFRALYNLLLIGYGYKPTNDVLDILFSLFCLSVGVVLQVLIYAEVLQLLNKNLSTSNNYQHMLRQLFEYMRYKHLPENLRKRIFLYFGFRFEKNYYKESEILNTLSENLRQDITLHTCQNLVERVEFFRDLPTSLLIRIVQCMKSEIYLTNDVIVKAGIAGDSMYFIASGTIAVYTSTGKEVCHLADGSHFGEISLLLENETRIASVVAVECCELFNLSRRDFQKAVGPYPQLQDRMRKIAQIRLRRTMRAMSSESLEFDETQLYDDAD